MEKHVVKNGMNTGVDICGPIESTIVKHNLHYHINGKASRISPDKAFFSRHNSIPTPEYFPIKGN